MAGTFSRSKQLISESWSVLNKDKELMLFPIFSGLAALLVSVSFLLPFFFASSNQTVHYIVLFFYYLVSYFVVTFFAAGLTAAAAKRLQGGDPTVGDGWSAAVKHLGGILVWSVISATVGVILQVIGGQKKNGIGQLVTSILGTAWNILTLFVVPIIVLEDKPSFEAIKESGVLFKKTWGENVVGGLGMGLIFFLLTLLGLLPILAIYFIHSTAVVALAVVIMALYWFGLAIISSSLNGIFMTALYLYAKTGTVPTGFSDDLIKNAYRVTAH